MKFSNKTRANMYLTVLEKSNKEAYVKKYIEKCYVIIRGQMIDTVNYSK